MKLAMDILFGLATLSCLFMVVVWGRIATEVRVPPNTLRYKLVAWGLCIASAGIAVGTIDRMMGDYEIVNLPPLALLTSAGLILVGKLCLLGSTAIGTNGRTLKIFAALSLVWVIIAVTVLR